MAFMVVRRCLAIHGRATGAGRWRRFAARLRVFLAGRNRRSGGGEVLRRGAGWQWLPGFWLAYDEHDNGEKIHHRQRQQQAQNSSADKASEKTGNAQSKPSKSLADIQWQQAANGTRHKPANNRSNESGYILYLSGI